MALHIPGAQKAQRPTMRIWKSVLRKKGGRDAFWGVFGLSSGTVEILVFIPGSTLEGIVMMGITKNFHGRWPA
jgi:hypothetical protein